MRDYVLLREYEAKQLTRFLNELVPMYEDTQLEDRAERLDAIRDDVSVEYDEDEMERTFDIAEDDLTMLVAALEELDGTKSSWLRAKIARRTAMPAVQMGFTTSVPIMAFKTGENPKPPN